MIKNKKVLCIILARGGSKGVERKNIQKLIDKPLIAYTIIEAKKSKYIDRIIVSSDDNKIRKVATEYGAEAPFKRPTILASDRANSLDASKHALMWVEKDENIRYDYIIDLLCTNPFKTSIDIDNVLDKLYRTNADSVIGVSKLKSYHPVRIKKIENDRIKNFCCQKEIPGANRQGLKPDAYIRNGSIYACKRESINKRVGSDNSRPYIMPAEKSVNIDEPLDFLLAETILKNKLY